MISAPIRTGTARRLGLRPPVAPLCGTIRFPRMTGEQMAAFEAAFADAAKMPGRWQLVFDDPKPEPPADHAWLGFPLESRHERRRRLGFRRLRGETP